MGHKNPTKNANAIKSPITSCSPVLIPKEEVTPLLETE
jgi:hypothetical protein